MRGFALALTLSFVSLSSLRAEEPAVLREYAKLREERDRVWAAYSKIARKAHTIEEVQAVAAKNPEEQFIKRTLDLAEKYAAHPAAVVPAVDVLRYIQPEGKYCERTLAILLKHPTSKYLVPAIPTLIGQNEETARLLRAVIAKHPDRKTQARACRLLVRYLADCNEKGTEANLDEEYRAKLERQTSPKHVKGLIDRLHHNRRELQALNAQLQDKFLKLLPDLAPGLPIPDAAVTDVAGKMHRLRDFQGKVLLVHVFSIERNRPEWLYYLQQSRWADEFKGRPIVRVNISVDEKKETFTTWLRHHPIADVNVWAGRDSEFFADWLGEDREQEQTFLVNAAGMIQMRSRGTNDLNGALDLKILDLFKEMKVPAWEEPAAPKVSDEKLTEAARGYEQLRLDFQRAGRCYARDYFLARNDDEKRQAVNEYSWQKYGTRAVELAEKHLKDPASFDLLAFRLRHNVNTDEAECMQALHLLATHHGDNPRMIELLQNSRFGQIGRALFLRKILEKNPDLKIQARAARMLKEFYEGRAGFAEDYLQANPELQRAIRRRCGEKYVEELLEAQGKNTEKRAKYVKLYDEKYAKSLPQLIVGKPMLATELTSLDGKKFKLSHLRGKVVYLNLFSIEDHRPTFSHQRVLSDAMKGKPFVLINVSVDERKENFEESLRRDPTPWVNTWCGRRSELYADWIQQGHQTSYLIDSKGVLRSWGVGWADLPDRAEELLAEMEKQGK